MNDPQPLPTDAEREARMFHEAYERLAPSFGYETRSGTREFDPASPNGKLMVAVCGELQSSRTPTPVGVEPVAYRHMHDDGWEYYDAPTGDDCPGCQALYTDQMLAVGRVPLTKAQRTRLFRNRDMAGIKAQLAEAEWHRIVQYIEVVHNIKQGGQHGTDN